jgi:hypothetical protein
VLCAYVSTSPPLSDCGRTQKKFVSRWDLATTSAEVLRPDYLGHMHPMKIDLRHTNAYIAGKQSGSLANAAGPKYCFLISD